MVWWWCGAVVVWFGGGGDVAAAVAVRACRSAKRGVARQRGGAVGEVWMCVVRT